MLEHHGWLEVGEKLSALAARGQWQEMPGLITDDILAEFCTQAATPAEMAAALQQRYGPLADRLAPKIRMSGGGNWPRHLSKYPKLLPSKLGHGRAPTSADS